jgi:hypothetical protein
MLNTPACVGLHAVAQCDRGIGTPVITSLPWWQCAPALYHHFSFLYRGIMGLVSIMKISSSP